MAKPAGSNPEPRNQFSHVSLSDPTREFRLLKLLHGELDAKIVCDLNTFNIQDHPSYYALSYCWGDSTNPVSIQVNDKQMIVNRNCWYALWQARCKGKASWYWIDSVCINQTDLDEKAMQVQGIAAIFRNADRVMASLGAEGDDSQFLFQGLRQLWPIDDAHQTPVVTQDTTTSADELKLQTVKWLISLDKDFSRFVNALKCFSDRPFFSRLWIYQEVFLASEVIMICGTEEADMLALKDILEVGSTWIMKDSADQEDEELQPWEQMRYMWNENGLFQANGAGLGRLPTIVRQLQLTGRKSTVQRLQNEFEGMEETLAFVRPLKCTDVRDKIFGLISVFGSSCKIKADYTVSAFDLAVLVLREYNKFSRANRSLELAHMLCDNLRLDLNTPEVRHALAVDQRTLPNPTDDEIGSKLPKDNNERCRMLDRTPWACCISATESGGQLTAPFKATRLQSDNTLKEDTSLEETGVSTPIQQGKMILADDRPVALVSSQTMANDWIAPLSQYMYTATDHYGYYIGLVFRKRNGNVYDIVGEAAFYHGYKPCVSWEDCGCQLGADSHADDVTCFNLDIDLKELLLLAIRLRASYHTMSDEMLSTEDYRPILPTASFPVTNASFATRVDSSEPTVLPPRTRPKKGSQEPGA